MTVIYSLSDKVASSNMQGLNSALGYVCVTYSIGWLFLCAEQRKRAGRWIPVVIPAWQTLLFGAIAVGSAYALVTYAMHWLPAAYAVMLTNGGIVLTVLAVSCLPYY